MKYLFIVQGEGRGHLTQALTLERHLKQKGHEVVEVLVGKSRTRELPDFFRCKLKAPLYRFESPNFLPTPANQRNNIAYSALYNIMRIPAFVRSIAFINRHIKSSGADIVVNFYELLTGMTYLFCRPKATQICIGHQYLFLHKDFQFPRTAARLDLALLKAFTRLTAIGADRMLALSFRRMPDDKRQRIFVVPPLLRKEALSQKVTTGDYVHGYMVNSGFSTQVMAWHKARPEIPLRFFWDRKNEKNVKRMDDTLSFYPIDDHTFLKEMSGCRAYASTAGFESICEAMYMGKPILMVPAHIEQECNAHDAMLSGAGIVSQDFALNRLLEFSGNFRPDTKFIFWANNTEVLLKQLIQHPEIEEYSFFLEKVYHIVKRYKLAFNKL